MLDLDLIRRDPERVRRSAKRRGHDPAFVDEVLRLDEEYRSTLTAVESAKAEKNRLSSEIGKAADKAAAARDLRPKLDDLSRRIEELENRVSDLSPDEPNSPFFELLAHAPNLLDDSVPDGNDESHNVVLRSWGEPPKFSFEPLPHWELGERLGIIDFQRAVKLSGSRFSILVGAGARLARALTHFFLDRAFAKGYVEIDPPILVSRETMWSTGQLSKFADAMFRDADAELFLIPTSEVPLTAMHGDEILPIETLPRKYAAYTPCFRKRREPPARIRAASSASTNSKKSNLSG